MTAIRLGGHREITVAATGLDVEAAYFIGHRDVFVGDGVNVGDGALNLDTAAGAAEGRFFGHFVADVDPARRTYRLHVEETQERRKIYEYFVI